MFIYIPLIHQSGMWDVDMKRATILWKYYYIKQSLVIYQKQVHEYKDLSPIFNMMVKGRILALNLGKHGMLQEHTHVK